MLKTAYISEIMEANKKKLLPKHVFILFKFSYIYDQKIPKNLNC